MRFPERLKEARQAKQYSQLVLARKAQVSPQMVKNWEQSVCEPRIANLISVATVLEVSVDWLLGLEER